MPMTICTSIQLFHRKICDVLVCERRKRCVSDVTLPTTFRKGHPICMKNTSLWIELYVISTSSLTNFYDVICRKTKLNDVISLGKNLNIILNDVQYSVSYVF